jgi:GntR family transcriptional regulator
MTAIEWSDGAPIYRQLKERVVAMLLDGLLKPGDALPSVRQVAAEYQLNPITVSRAYQELADEPSSKNAGDSACTSRKGHRKKLLTSERERFLREEWPLVWNASSAWAVARRLLQPTEDGHERDDTIRARGRQRARPAQGLQEQGGARRHRVPDPAAHRRPDRPNGAGKTTALKAMLGLIPFEGELRVSGAIRAPSATS